MVLEKAEGGNKSTSTTQLNNSTQQKNKTGPGALAPPHAGLGRRGHLERRCRCDARARGAGAGEEGALRCVRAEKRGGRRERRGDLKTPSSPSFLLFFSSSSPLLLSHRRPLYTMSQSLVSFFALPKIEEKTLCEPRKPIFEFFYFFLPQQRLTSKSFLSSSPLRVQSGGSLHRVRLQRAFLVMWLLLAPAAAAAATPRLAPSESSVGQIGRIGIGSAAPLAVRRRFRSDDCRSSFRTRAEPGERAALAGMKEQEGDKRRKKKSSLRLPINARHLTLPLKSKAKRKNETKNRPRPEAPRRRRRRGRRRLPLHARDPGPRRRAGAQNHRRARPGGPGRERALRGRGRGRD